MLKISAILFSMVFAVSTFASEVSDPTNRSESFNFNFFGNSGGRTTYVSCDYAQPVAEEWMAKFGATDVEVRCYGGITPTGAYPLSLRIDYTGTSLSGSTQTDHVVIESDMDHRVCDYDTQLMRTLLRRLPNIKATAMRDHCFSTDSRYEYQIDVTTSI